VTDDDLPPRIRVNAEDVQILVELLDEGLFGVWSRKLDRSEILAIERLRKAAAGRFKMTWLHRSRSTP
jgi:hypothetical protein